MFPFCCHVGRDSDTLRAQIHFSPKKSYWTWTPDKELTPDTLWPELGENMSTVNPHKGEVTECSVYEAKSDTSSLLLWSADEDYLQNTNVELPKKDNSFSYGTVPREKSESRSIENSCSYFPVPMTKILPHLYLGSYDDAINENHLKAKRITHILSLIGKQSSVDFVQHKHSPMHDYGISDLKEVLTKVSKFMKLGQEDGNNVLVHCKCGQNRSATVVIAYLMLNTKRTLYRAHKMVKKLRPLIQINRRYAKQLLTLEKEIFGKNSLPCDWMELEEVDMATGDVSYKHENLSPGKYRLMLDSNSL